MSERSVQEVFEAHLRCLQHGDVEADVVSNYAPDAILLMPHQAYRGREGVREAQMWLREQIGAARFSFPAMRIHDPYALLQWHCYSGDTVVDDGVDSFVIREGRIAFHSVHCTIRVIERDN